MTKQEIYEIPLSELCKFSKKELLEMVKVVSPYSRMSASKEDLYWTVKNVISEHIRTLDIDKQMRDLY